MTAILTDLAGQRFGFLTVLGALPRASRTSRLHWRCRCTCGQLAVVRAVQLLHGRITCGSCRPPGGANQMKRERIQRERHPNPTLAERIALALGGNGTAIDLPQR